MRSSAPGSLLLAALAAASLCARPAPAQVFTNFAQTGRPAGGPGLEPGAISIAGTSLAHRAAVSDWAAGTAARLERAIGDGIPVRGRSYRIALDGSLPAGPAGIARQAYVADGVFVQVLFVPDVRTADPEDLLESFCAMLLASWIPEAGDGRQAIDPPDYFSVGLAQNLHPSLRARNRRVVAGILAEEGQLPAFARILTWDRLPPGRCREKAISGLALGYILSQPDSAALLRRMAGILARGDPVSAAWIADATVGPGAASRLDADWRAWLLREQERAVDELGSISSALVDRLRRELVIAPLEAGLEDDPAGGAVSLDSLIARRRIPAVRALAAERSQRIMLLAIGKDTEFVAAADAYRRFFNGLAAGRASFFLRQWLRQADAGAEALAIRVKARTEYVTAAEHAMGPTIPAPAPRADAPAPPSPKAAKDYVDQFERRFNNPPEGAERAPGPAGSKP